MGQQIGGFVSDGQSLIHDNQVSNCAIGIDFFVGSSLIGNTVNTASTGQIGIYGSDDPTTLLDQNTAIRVGRHTSFISGARVRNNAF